MASYFENMMQKCEERTGVKATPVPPPWFGAGSEKQYAKQMKETGLFGGTASCIYIPDV